MSGSSISLMTQSLSIPTGMAGWALLQKMPMTSFTQFTKDPVLQRQVAYFKANITSATTAAKLLSDPNLANVALTAYGLSAQIGYNGLMTKVLNSNVADSTSLANKMVSAGYKQIATAFGYGTPATAAQPAVASSASVTLDNMTGSNSFSTFSGTFGGITLKNVDLSEDTTSDAIADSLTQAFRKADGNRADITVSTDSDGNLVFTDALGRGTAVSFAWTDSSSDAPAAEAPSSTVAGSVAVAASGGSAQTTAQAAVASSATITLGNLTGSNSFSSFSGAFGDINVDDVDLSADTSPTEIAASLQTAFQAADGGSTDITVTTDSDGNLVFKDAAGRGTASGFQWDTDPDDTDPPTADYAAMGAAGSTAHAGAGYLSWIDAVPSSAVVNVSGTVSLSNNFSAFSGTFGGVALNNVDLSGDFTIDQVATTLQSAFQSQDYPSTSITVSVSNGQLVFKDTQGRGTASNFSWTANTADTDPPTATMAPALVSGSQAVPASGGPNVTSSSFVDKVVQKYTEAMFDQVVGNTDSTLGNALYAQQNLSSVTNWYSVIADTKLATVVETALGLPATSFAKLDVDTQAQELAQKMNIKDLQDPTKLNRLLTRYVAIASAQSSASSTSTNPAVVLLSGMNSSSSSLSSSTMSALLTST